MVDAIAPAETRAQVRPARRGDQAPLTWIRLRSAPAQPPRSHSMCQDCEHPFIQWSIARLDERESDSDEQEEPCQCSSDWRRRNGQLIPDAVGRGGESHEGGNLPGGQPEKQGVLDIQMIRNLVRACHSSMSSGAERSVHGGHDLRGKEHRDQTDDTADHSSLAEFLAALAADHMCNQQLECARYKSQRCQTRGDCAGEVGEVVDKSYERCWIHWIGVLPLSSHGSASMSGGAAAERAEDDAHE